MAKFLEVLNELDSIRIVPSISSWQDSIQQCFKPLLDKGFITDQYIHAAIKAGEILDFYYLLAEGLGMPHARAEDGALKNGFSMLIINSGVSFKNHRNNPIYCLIGLVATNKTDHIDAIQDISEIFYNEELIPQLARLTSVKEVSTLLSKLC
ncbi:MAG: PTS sugar transporter subunit IIA [Brevinema sp.]